MQEKLYFDFYRIQKESFSAFQYLENHFDELMSRPVSFTLYGPDSYGPGAANPSRHMRRDKERILKWKNRRKDYKEYNFDKNWDLLYSRDYADRELDCTVLHCWIGETNYARFFLKDTNVFYTSLVFSTHYVEGKPVYFSMAEQERIYVEYFQEILLDSGKTMIQYTWYDFYPNRIMSKDGTPLTKTAPFGAPNSPVFTGSGIFEPVEWPPKFA